MIRLAGCLVLLVLALGCSDAHGATPPADHWGFSGAAAKQFDAAYSACRKEESANARTGTETPSSGGNGYIGQLYELQAKPPAGLSRPQLRAWWTGCQGGLGTPERFALQAGLLSLGRPSVDVDAGSYRGVALGDPAARALRRFGRPRQRNGVHTPSYPVGATFENGGPHLLRNPDGVEGEPDLLRYQDVAVLAGPGGISAIVIDDPAAATFEGVAVGDPLSFARQLYPSLRCHGRRPLGETVAPPACAGKVAPHRYVWFGNDPVRVIALSPFPMD